MTDAVDNWPSLLDDVSEAVDRGESITFEQAMDLADLPDYLLSRLAELADKSRRNFSRDRVDLCSIVNARSGRCSEDCKFCAQSSRHNAEIQTHAMKSPQEIVDSAKGAEANGAHRFCIVTSGPDLSDADFSIACEAVERIKNETELSRCASMGTLTKARAQELSDAGLDRYHHNVETARGFFGNICTTHLYDEKAATIRSLEVAGIEKCVGGILNLGESKKQRIEFAFELLALDPISVPINFLNPRPGTPLAGRPLMPASEAIKYLSIFRLVLPKSYIRLAGGRTETFGDDPGLPFRAGINGLLIGELLTTGGPAASLDLELLGSLGFDTDKSD